MKATMAIEWLSACGGCHLAIIDLHERLIELTGKARIVHCPMLVDAKEIPSAGLGIVTGGVRTFRDREVAKNMRDRCELLIAFGTCAVYGGISGAANVHKRKDILETVYIREAMESEGFPGVGDALGASALPRLEAKVYPLGGVVTPDLYLPGCPPGADYVFESLTALVEGREPRAARRTVCSSCGRAMVRGEVSAPRRWAEGLPEPDTCFLSQGYLCMGPVTLERCGSPCPNKGVVCTGCCGPSHDVIVEPNRDIRTELARCMSRLTRIRYGHIVKHIEQQSKTYYTYALSSPVVNLKPGVYVKKWMEQSGGDL
jgi:F420-non-reducing hydrogenase small subunit